MRFLQMIKIFISDICNMYKISRLKSIGDLAFPVLGFHIIRFRWKANWYANPFEEELMPSPFDWFYFSRSVISEKVQERSWK